MDLRFVEELKDARTVYLAARAVCEVLPGTAFNDLRTRLATPASGPVLTSLPFSIGQEIVGSLMRAGIPGATLVTAHSVDPVRSALVNPTESPHARAGLSRLHGKWLTVLAIGFAALAAAFAFPSVFFRQEPAAVVAPPAQQDFVPRPKKSGREIADVAIRGSATLFCDDAGERKQGSGFFVAPGVLFTNAHVLCTDSNRVQVQPSSGPNLTGWVTYRDDDLDFAQVLVDTNIPPLVLGDAGTVQRGDTVFVVGAPRGMTFSISQGIVSHPMRIIAGQGYIQVDAAVNPGNSGGPLLDEQGSVIGIVSMKHGGAENVGFALPINLIYELQAAALTFARPAVDSKLWRERERMRQGELDRERLELDAMLDRPSVLHASYAGASVHALVAMLTGARGHGLPDRLRFSVCDEHEQVCCSVEAGVRGWDNMGEKLPGEVPSIKYWIKKGVVRGAYAGHATLSIAHCPPQQRGSSLRVVGGMPPRDRVVMSGYTF